MKENRDPIKKAEKDGGEKWENTRQIIKQICIRKWWRKLSYPLEVIKEDGKYDKKTDVNRMDLYCKSIKLSKR